MYLSEPKGCVKETPDAPASLENFGLLLLRLLGPLGKNGVRLEQQSGIPRGMPDLSRQAAGVLQ
jgi:hypothetical protein